MLMSVSGIVFEKLFDQVCEQFNISVPTNVTAIASATAPVATSSASTVYTGVAAGGVKQMAMENVVVVGGVVGMVLMFGLML